MTSKALQTLINLEKEKLELKKNYIAELELQLEKAKGIPIEDVVVKCKDEYWLGAVERHYKLLGLRPFHRLSIDNNGWLVSLNKISSIPTLDTFSPAEFFMQYPVRLACEIGPPPEDGTKVWYCEYNKTLRRVEVNSTNYENFEDYEIFFWYRGDYFLTEAKAQAEADRINALILKHNAQ